MLLLSLVALHSPFLERFVVFWLGGMLLGPDFGSSLCGWFEHYMLR